MMICCLGPILLIFLFGSGAKALGAPAWIVIGAVGVFVIVHFLTMKKSHEDSNDKPAKQDGTEKQPDSRSDHDCCH